MDNSALSALRTLLDPEVVAAWLDEVEGHRRLRDESTIPLPTNVQREPTLHEPLLTVRQLGDRLGLGKGVIYRMVHANKMPHIRLGHRIRFVWSQVQEWLSDPVRDSAS